jgi:hypothetical protein
MRLVLTWCKLPGVSLLLAACVLIGSFSVTTGLRIVPGPDRPEISLDVCHPLQTLNLAAATLIAPPASGPATPVLYEQGVIAQGPAAKTIDRSFAPVPPPPRQLV